MARAASQTKIHHPESISTPSRDDFAAMLEQSFETQSPQEGAVIKGKIVAIENDFAMVDVGLKTEGRVPLKEFAMPGIPANVQVGDGENRGRDLNYTNVVRDLKAIGLWKGDAVTFELPRAALSSASHDGMVVLLQRDRYGQVIGATMITTSGGSGKH